KDLETGQAQSIEIKDASRLDSTEIESMRQRMNDQIVAVKTSAQPTAPQSLPEDGQEDSQATRIVHTPVLPPIQQVGDNESDEDTVVQAAAAPEEDSSVS